MADAYITPTGIAPGVVLTTLYTCPAAKQAVVNVTVANNNAAAAAVNIYVTSGGGAAADAVRAHVSTIAAGASAVVGPLRLPAGYDIRVISSQNNVSFQPHGIVSDA